MLKILFGRTLIFLKNIKINNITKLKQYEIEVFGSISIDAKSRKDAMNQVKEQFENGELTYEDLSFDITYDEDEDN